jgi:hypothetical protein
VSLRIGRLDGLPILSDNLSQVLCHVQTGPDDRPDIAVERLRPRVSPFRGACVTGMCRGARPCVNAHPQGPNGIVPRREWFMPRQDGQVSMRPPVGARRSEALPGAAW